MSFLRVSKWANVSMLVPSPFKFNTSGETLKLLFVKRGLCRSHTNSDPGWFREQVPLRGKSVLVQGMV